MECGLFPSAGLLWGARLLAHGYRLIGRVNVVHRRWVRDIGRPGLGVVRK
jgi:hypothetical protein